MTRLVLLLLGSAIAISAAAQAYPVRPVSMIVPFSAGGPTDTIGRIMAERMGKSLGQTVVIDNATGAAGSLGVARVARAAPDGYTLSIGHWATHVVNGAIYELQYDLLRDFEPVAMIAINPQLVIAGKTVPANDLKEFIAWVRANQDRISAGTGGFGAASHVAGVYFQSMTGTKFPFVHYRGAAPAMKDILGGHVEFMFDQAAQSLPLVRNGSIKAYAVTSRTRIAAAPDIPSVDEAGLPGLYISIWHAIWAPRATPKNVISRLNAVIVETLADAAVRKKLTDIGQEIPPREQQTPEFLAAHHKAETDKWWPLIKAAGIKAEQ